MSEKIRREFEEWANQFFEFNAESGTDILFGEMQWAWRAWQASRAAMVVELPPEREERFIDSYQEGWNDAIDSCRVRVESAGVTCT